MKKVYGPSADRSELQKVIGQTASEASQPSTERLRMAFGTVYSIEPETNQIQVRKLSGAPSSSPDLMFGEGRFIPLLQPLHIIHQLYGPLREGQIVRVFWRGRLNNSTSATAEVIGNEGHDVLEKQPEEAEMNIGFWKVLTGSFPGG